MAFAWDGRGWSLGCELLEVGGGSGAGEGAGDEDAALLAGGHFADGFVAECFPSDLVEEVFGAGAHAFGDGEVGPEGRGGEEAGEDGVDAGGLEGGSAGEVRGDDAEALAELREIPAWAAEDADGAPAAVAADGEGVEFAGDGFEQGRFAAAVGAEDGEVLAGVEAEVDVVEDGLAATGDGDVLEGEDGVGMCCAESGRAGGVDRIDGRSAREGIEVELFQGETKVRWCGPADRRHPRRECPVCSVTRQTKQARSYVFS